MITIFLIEVISEIAKNFYEIKVVILEYTLRKYLLTIWQIIYQINCSKLICNRWNGAIVSWFN